MADETRNYIGVAMGLDVSDLKTGLTEASKRIGEARADFRATSSDMENWQQSIKGVSAKVTELDRVLAAQKSKLAGLRAEYEKVAAEQGENSQAARNLYIRMQNQVAVVNQTQREFDNYSETLQQARDGTIDLTQVTLRGGQAIQNLGDDAKKTGDGFTIMKGAIAGLIANGLTKLFDVCKNGISTMLGLADATREYRQTLATLDSAAKDVGVSTDYIRDKFTDMMGVFNDEGSVTEGLNNLLTAGFDEKTLDNITQSLEGAALKWKDTLKFEGLADSLQEWIGSDGANLSGNFAELLERMGYNLEEVQEKTAGMTDEQRRNYAANLLASEGLNKVSQDYREQNKDMIEAQQSNVEFQNTVAAVGEKIEPITTKIRQGFTRILEKILELANDVDFAAIGNKISEAFDKFINEILPKIIEGFTWIIDNKDTIIAVITGIGAAFVAWKVTSIVTGAVTALKSMTAATQGLTVAQRLLNLVMKANPIGIIVSLIAGLVAAFITLWNKSDAFRNFWIGLWENIKKACSNAWQGIKDIFAKITGWIDGVKESFTNAGKNIVYGIWDGIKNASNWIKDKISGFAGNVASWFKKAFKIGSPSKLMADEVGEFVGEGVGVGVIDSIPTVKKQLMQFSDFVTDNLSNIKSGLNINANANGSGSLNGSNGNTVINAGQTIYFNGNLSRKQIKQLENDNYTSIKMRLKTEGAI